MTTAPLLGEYVLQMVLPDPRRALLGLAMVLGTSGALFAGTSATEDFNTQPFRLGTAAAPFGWAKDLADFDQDGKLDVAVADRRNTRLGQTHYELLVDLSGGPDQQIRFSSPEPSVHLHVADADGDGDLDILFARVISRVVIGLWVNDGDGRFRERALGSWAARTLPTSHAGRTPPPNIEAGAALAAGGRVVSGEWISARVPAPPHDDAGTLATRNARRHRTLRGFPSISRAPPGTTPIV